MEQHPLLPGRASGVERKEDTLELHEPTVPDRGILAISGASETPRTCPSCSGLGTWPASEQVLLGYSMIRIRPDLPRVRCPRCDGSGSRRD